MEPDLLARIQDHERRLLRLESLVESFPAHLDGLRAISNHLVEQAGAFASRITAMGDMLAEHERRVRDMVEAHETRLLSMMAEHEARERAKWEEDLRYRQARELEERGQRKTSLWSLVGTVATLAAVVLAWAMGKV